MISANDDGPSESVLSGGFEIEALAMKIGISEDDVRRIFRIHGKDIKDAARQTVEDVVLDIAHHEGLLPLGEPEEIPEATRLAAEKLLPSRRWATPKI